MALSVGHEEIASRLLLALPMAVRKQLLPHLKPAHFAHGQVLYRPGDTVTEIYFINRGMVSLIKMMRDGSSVEVSTRGIEGVTTPGALFGINTAVFECVVQLPLSGFSIPAKTLRAAMAKSHVLNSLLQGYVYVAADQLAQVAACNGLHSIKERCCRWLLLAHDSARSDDFLITQDSLAAILGVHRPGIAIAAANLKKVGLIRYTHGHVTVIDRAGLEASACECYRVIRDQFDALFARRR